ncbi:hypothetical protein HPP92_007808 [Vanilla planifolia]|uniref:Ariadne domain-containing protein n=1 Tax=Vanilla planifolia TaxID=51239 RepID=A0A835RN42_VANPL|nr:hypothetical protein HPP92_007808 [Vanilla planifolia]
MKQDLFEDQQQQLESNVEKLSLLLEKDFQDFSDEEVMENMKHVINLSSVIDRLCKQMYQCIENDLLYPLQRASHHIAPYKSKGPERASELTGCRVSTQSRNNMSNNVDLSAHHDSAVNASGDASVVPSRRRLVPLQVRTTAAQGSVARAMQSRAHPFLISTCLQRWLTSIFYPMYTYTGPFVIVESVSVNGLFDLCSFNWLEANSKAVKKLE